MLEWNRGWLVTRDRFAESADEKELSCFSRARGVIHVNVQWNDGITRLDRNLSVEGR
jgi:hypothetical protein